MILSKRLLSALIFLLTCFAAPALRAADPPKPKVRAITGFITIDAKSYPSQIEDAVKFLSRVREAVKTAGYDVQGIRISTQPFPDYTQALSRADALKLLRGIDGLAAKLELRTEHRAGHVERFRPHRAPSICWPRFWRRPGIA